MTIEHLTAFLAWCTLINFGILIFSAIALMLMRDWVIKIHSGWYGVPEADLPGIYFRYLATYKIAILVFNLVPYLALRIVA